MLENRVYTVKRIKTRSMDLPEEHPNALILDAMMTGECHQTVLRGIFLSKTAKMAKRV